MSYFGILALFIGPPLSLLALLNWQERGKGLGQGIVNRLTIPALVVHVLLALIYTTPWDNYLVATGVWWYDPDLVIGLTLGWVPIEEYTFFVVQTLLSGLWLIMLLRHFSGLSAAPTRTYPRLRLGSAAIVSVIWLASVILLVSGWRPGTYLGLELAWGLIPVITQLAFGADILWNRRRLVAVAIVIPTLYLCLADAVALRAGTWTIDPAQSTGIMLFGVLPLEEFLFFLLTNTLIVFGMVLLLDEKSHRRLPFLRVATRDNLIKE